MDHGILYICTIEPMFFNTFSFCSSVLQKKSEREGKLKGEKNRMKELISLMRSFSCMQHIEDFSWKDLFNKRKAGKIMGDFVRREDGKRRQKNELPTNRLHYLLERSIVSDPFGIFISFFSRTRLLLFGSSKSYKHVTSFIFLAWVEKMHICAGI